MPPDPPRATYRLQLTPDFGFAAAAGRVPYLAELGISHLYLSPITTARKGSMHGYDVTDPTRLNPELGGAAGFDALCAACRAADLGILVDFVPNHMAAVAENPWWYDVLRRGRESDFAAFFDIDWRRYDGYEHPAVTLPILGSSLEEAIDKRQLRIAGDELRYFEHRLPLSAPSLQNADRDADAGALRPLLRQQHYRLVHWQRAAAEINYRRFFDINELVGLRIEDPAVFDAVHRLLFRLVEERRIHGVRLDHIDGLRDPAAYCRRLEAELAARGLPQPYILVEKILEADEPLPDLPGVSGTTGYEWGNLITRHLIDPAGLSALRAYWQEKGGQEKGGQEKGGQEKGRQSSCADAKAYVLNTLFAGELEMLVSRLAQLPAMAAAQAGRAQLRQALAAYIIALPVYRTYITPGRLSPHDAAIVRQALRDARQAAAQDCHAVLDRLEGLLLAAGGTAEAGEFVARLQQLSGPVMAKALEDTHFYRAVALLALNEVGGSPDSAAADTDEWHRRLRQRQAAQPAGLTATATHDTKRGEDARLRIASLTEISADWIALMKAWLRRPPAAGLDAGHEYLLYQTLLGAWDDAEGGSCGDARKNARDGAPGEDFRRRLKQYAVKALRESKTATNWLQPDEAYEQAALAFLDARLDDADFRAAFRPLAARAALLGALSGLSQLAFKTLMPGVPDFYQGSEFWDLALVDPDNRRPVDWAARALALDAVRAPDWPALQRRWQDGRIKLALQYRLLQLRKRLPLVFERGAYIPLPVAGDPHVTAFARAHDGDMIVCLALRRFAPVSDGGRRWPDHAASAGSGGSSGSSSIRLPDGLRFCDNLTEGRLTPSAGTVRLADLLGTLPVAVLSARRQG
ncbi:MAG TPA: malto-oligosyltrehalose synthase [Ferrovibrio sp.]|uniref:malto-oligosyltrehalose synthase n=1 Tax=Ferrovibrio sp. TaxID=1917215 RepID=UPI002ED3D9C4